MCKIICLTDTSKVSDMPAFTEAMRALLSDQKDGFGYAIQNEDYSVYGGRTLRPSAPIVGAVTLPWCESYAESFGAPNGVTRGALFHGRISTNNVSLLNTHPISKANWHLIHNGVVRDAAPDAHTVPRLTTNDSEFVLDHLISGGITAVAEHLTGYYAVGAFAPDGSMHIFRDKTARLVCAYSTVLESYVFATNETIIAGVGMHINEMLWPSPVKDDTYLRFVNGKATEQTGFISRGYSYQESRYASQSLGFELRTPNVPSSTTPRSQYVDEANKALEAYYDKLAWKDDTPANRQYSDLLDNITDEFLDLIDRVDDSYRITDNYGRLVTAMEFSRMSLTEQVKCKVLDQNGKKVRKYINNNKNKGVAKNGNAKAKSGAV